MGRGKPARSLTYRLVPCWRRNDRDPGSSFRSSTSVAQVTVLSFEGTHPILYGTATLTAGVHHARGYLARPDLKGAFPGVLVVDAQLGSAHKNLCRMLARHGYAALAPDLTTQSEALAIALGFLQSATWLKRPGIAGLAFREGGLALVAQPPARLEALCLVGVPIQRRVWLRGVRVLGLYGGADSFVERGGLTRLRTDLADASWVLYPGVDAGFFWGEQAGDRAAAADATSRLLAFLTDWQPPPPPE